MSVEKEVTLEKVVVEVKPGANIPVKKKAQARTSNEDGFCVYLGPNIRGVIQRGTVFRGTKETVLKTISKALEKYPEIAALIVPDKTISEDRIKVKTAGNFLNEQFKKLAGTKKGG